MLIKNAILSAQFYDYDLSSDGLINLKNSKVSDSIIVYLFEKQENKKSNNPTSSNKSSNVVVTQNKIASNSAIKNLNLKPGIYYFEANENKYVKLSSIRSSMQMGAGFGFGYKLKWFYEFNGESAMRSIPVFKPEFILVEGTNQSGTVFEPSRFVLINVEAKKNKRRIDISNGSNGMKSTTGPSFFSEADGMVIPKYSELSDGIYSVSFEKNLPNGQYFFAPSQIVKDISMEFFEFGIKK
jgi:hypothetical protein